MSKFIDLSGKRYGELVVIEKAHIKTFPSGQETVYWRCVCDCGGERIADGRDLKSRNSKTCGHIKNPVSPIFSLEDNDLSAVAWSRHTVGYAQSNDFGLAHRVVLERKIGRKLKEGELTDHINRNKLDNRRDNLRVADKSLNTINRDLRPDNTTGHVGVYKHWPKEWQEKGWNASWNAIVYRNGKGLSLGYFKTPAEAARAREQHLRKL